MSSLERYWYSRNPVSLLLLPLSLLFCAAAFVRRLLYRVGIKNTIQNSVPVVVVGNISVGGTGKTPLLVWLCQDLLEQGYKPGVVSRGYGGHATNWPHQVTADSDSYDVGDEPLLIARRLGVPVYIDPNRPRAVEKLLHEQDCDIILSDDGLQHYALDRDIEIAVIDGKRGVGNGFCLPAGPLRELPGRLQQVDLIISNGASPLAKHMMTLEPVELVSVTDHTVKQPIATFSGQVVNAIAGIGHPQRFFDTLKTLGYEAQCRSFPDHHQYQQSDLPAEGDVPVVMTEKDAVKCQKIAKPNCWYLKVEAKPDSDFQNQIRLLIRDIKDG